MVLTFEKRKQAFIIAGEKIEKVLQASQHNQLTAIESQLYQKISVHHLENPWFTPDNIRQALKGICSMLKADALNEWLAPYQEEIQTPEKPKTIAVIMAGNIPLVGFHDMMCVLLSGHHVLGKLSGQDSALPVIMGKLLCEAEPALEHMIHMTEEVIGNFDAVIATGSNNSARYFEYYFGRYPHIIRKNRSSLAILSGQESEQQLKAMADDIFCFFGRGCRSVSRLWVPQNYDMEKVLNGFSHWSHLQNHHKYYNNYEYQKAILLVEGIDHLDNGFAVIQKSDQLSSPLAVVYYQEYRSLKEVSDFLNKHRDNIQCIVAGELPDEVSAQPVAFGQSQNPGPSVYADGVDTIRFLVDLYNA